MIMTHTEFLSHQRFGNIHKIKYFIATFAHLGEFLDTYKQIQLSKGGSASLNCFYT